MLSPAGQRLVALVAAFVIAVVATPGGYFWRGPAPALSGQRARHPRPVPRSRRRTCSTTSSRRQVPSTATGARARPAAASRAYSWPEPCPAWSPARSSGSNCCPARTSSTWWPAPSWHPWAPGSPCPGRIPQARPAPSGRTIATPVLVVLSAAVGCAAASTGSAADRSSRRSWPAADPPRHGNPGPGHRHPLPLARRQLTALLVRRRARIPSR